MNLVDAIFTLAFALIMVGAILMWLPKLRHMKWCFEVRELLVKEYESRGDFKKAQKAKNEIHALRARLPIYSKAMVAIGVVLLVLGCFL